MTRKTVNPGEKYLETETFDWLILGEIWWVNSGDLLPQDVKNFLQLYVYQDDFDQ